MPLLILIIGIDLLCHPILNYWINSLSEPLQLAINVVYYVIPFLLFFLLIGNRLYKWRKRFRQIFTHTVSFFQLIYLCKILALAALFAVVLVGLLFSILEYVGIFLPDLTHIGYAIATIVAAIPFFLLPYGIFVNRHRYQVRKLSLKLSKLPEALEGLKIVQISDIHAGSFFDKRGFEKGVAMINALNPDIIFFTGDLVNNRSIEFKPFLETFNKLQAKYGVFSVLGNHDYGEYVAWPSKNAKVENIQELVEMQRSMGWNVLMNENHILNIKQARVAIIGVENYSAKLRFPKYGNLEKACIGIKDDDLQLLLSHDPSHWRFQVLKDFHNIDITFSGHTHGMQFGLEYGNLRWSPISYVYKEWADLYSDGEQHLYVNRGFGVLGYPGRVGILPEITCMTISLKD